MSSESGDMRPSMLALDDRTATISECGTYRYDLTRRWSDGPTALFIMLNPSTADAEIDDPTIRRCIGFAKREGCAALAVVNLFALRATNPGDLLVHRDPLGVKNSATIRRWLRIAGGPVIAAWGASKMPSRRLCIEELVRIERRALWCLGTTKTGAPRHPLYVKADAPLTRFPAAVHIGGSGTT